MEKTFALNFFGRNGRAIVVELDRNLARIGTKHADQNVFAQAVWAEVLAKAAFVSGCDDGAELITSFGATGLMIHDSGAVTYLPGVDEFLLS